MSIKSGDCFNGLVVTDKIVEAAKRWSSYHHCCRLVLDEPEEKILQACLNDEFEEIKSDPLMMGVGLYAYNKAYERA